MRDMFWNVFLLSFQIGFVIAAVYLWKRIGEKKYYAIGRYFIWLLIGLRLLIPINLGIAPIPLQSNYILNVFKLNFEFGEENDETYRIIENGSNNEQKENLLKESWEQQAAHKISEDKVSKSQVIISDIQDKKEGGKDCKNISIIYIIKQVLPYIWIIGIFIYFIYEGLSYLTFQKKLARWRNSISKSEQQVFDYVAAELKIFRKVKIYRCSQVASPMMTGIIYPCVYLPKKSYDEKMLYFIFKHELTHIKHFDIYYKLLMMVIKGIYWFQPLIYLMYQMAVCDMEEYCDFTVIKKKDLKYRQAYSFVMLQNLIEQNKQLNCSLTTCFYGGKMQMKNRFKNIISNEKKKYGGILIGVFALLVIISGNVVLNGEAKATKKADSKQGKVGTAEESKQDITHKNILLLGIEKFGAASQKNAGRADTIILATVKQDKIIFTNIQRNLYAKEGENAEKLSSLYRFGKGAKIKEVLEQKMDIKIDYTMSIDFRGLEKIIDSLGGVNVNITKEEADYLNSTNYISKKEFRNLSSGTQLLNGNQALGYARIRAVAYKDGNTNEFGRGERNLIILKSMLEKCKDINLTNLPAIVSECINFVTTDMSSKDILSLVQTIDLKSTNIKTQQIPERDSDCSMVRINNMAVIEYDFSNSKSVSELKAD